MVSTCQIKKQSATIRKAVRTGVLVLGSSLLMQNGMAQSPANYGERLAQQIWKQALSQYHQGNTAGCYQNLQRLDQALLGDVTYDRLFGLCAQGAGQHNEALLAYNRILSQQPQNADIRMERARVFYNLNLLDQAREEFEWLQDKNPPAEAQRAIGQYMQAIDRRQARFKRYSRLKISTSLGYDDNANSASQLNEFLGFTLNPSSKAQSSPYVGLTLSADHQHVISHNSGLKFSTSLGSKHYPDAEFVDQDLITLGIGYEQRLKNSARGVDLLGYAQDVDGHLNSKGLISRAYYRFNINQKTTITPYYKVSAIRFSDNLLAKNVNQHMIGGAVRYKPSLNSKGDFGVDLSFGRDYPIYRGTNFEVDLNSLKLDYRHKFSDKLTSNSSLSYTIYDFEKAFFPLAFPESRDDELISFSSRFDWKVSDQLKISPILGFRDLSSSVDIYSYDRWFAEINMSYQWLW